MRGVVRQAEDRFGVASEVRGPRVGRSGAEGTRARGYTEGAHGQWEEKREMPTARRAEVRG